MPPIKLHRCSWTFLHTDMDACWKVQRALDENHIEYEVVKHGFGNADWVGIQVGTTPTEVAQLVADRFGERA